MESTTIRVGIIGANTINWASISHIPALKLIPEFEFTAVSTYMAMLEDIKNNTLPGSRF